MSGRWLQVGLRDTRGTCAGGVGNSPPHTHTHTVCEKWFPVTIIQGHRWTSPVRCGSCQGDLGDCVGASGQGGLSLKAAETPQVDSVCGGGCVCGWQPLLP